MQGPNETDRPPLFGEAALWWGADMAQHVLAPVGSHILRPMSQPTALQAGPPLHASRRLH